MEPKKIKLLKIFVSSTDVVDHALLYESILRKAKAYGLAGGTAVKGAMGYGISSELRNSRFCPGWSTSPKAAWSARRT